MSGAAEQMAEHNWSFSAYYQILSNFYSALSKQETIYFLFLLDEKKRVENCTLSKQEKA